MKALDDASLEHLERTAVVLGDTTLTRHAIQMIYDLGVADGQIKALTERVAKLEEA